MNWKNVGVTAGGIVAGEYAWQKFVVRDPANPSAGGFVDQEMGFGWDDVVHALVLTVFIGTGHLLFKAKGVT